MYQPPGRLSGHSLKTKNPVEIFLLEVTPVHFTKRDIGRAVGLPPDHQKMEAM